VGVDLAPVLKDTEAHKIITFENLIGKHIAIDAFNTIYQFLAIIRGQDGEPLKDLQGNVTSHLSGLFNRTINLIEEQIKPIYVFDGPPNPLKKAEIDRRREIRQDAVKQMGEAIDAGDEAEAVKFAQASSKLTGPMIEEAKKLLEAMGIPVIQAAQDGESQAAYLVNKNLAWAAGSQDYDSLLFGAPRIVRNLSQNRTRKFGSTTVKVDLEWYSLPKVLEILGITQAQLIDIGILTGVDFFPGVEGIGVKTALKLIKEHQDLESMMAKKIEVRKKPLELDMELVQQVREIFLHPLVETNLPPIKWTSPDVGRIKEILCETHNFSADRVDSAITRLVKKNAQKTQVTMDSFFVKK
jgi:flap endonuclease-1